MLLTPEEEVTGELRHSMGAKTALTVDICNGHRIVHMDQKILAQKARSEVAQGKANCQQLEAIDMPMQLGTSMPGDMFQGHSCLKV